MLLALIAVRSFAKLIAKVLHDEAPYSLIYSGVIAVFLDFDEWPQMLRKAQNDVLLVHRPNSKRCSLAGPRALPVQTHLVACNCLLPAPGAESHPEEC